MNIDAIGRTVTVTREELRNHQVYLQLRDKIHDGYHLVVLDPPPRRPWNALTLTRAQARDTRNYEAAKVRAQKAGKTLWIED